MQSNKTVAVAMSGGVDSSVAAFLLLETGYNVVGITGMMENSDNSQKIAERAERMCKKLDIKHHVLDLSISFKKHVIDYFENTYKKAFTPNPCIMCNKFIKWGEISKYAINTLQADYYATGHYAKIVKKDEKYYLYPAKDASKDQIYYLFELNQSQLSQTIFPLTDYTKSEVREIAQKNDLIEEQYKESQDICFISKSMTTQKYLRNILGKKCGDFVDVNTMKKIGEHSGCYQFTIGQRKGIGIAYSEPLYVVDVVGETNTVYVGVRENLFSKNLTLSNPIMHDYENSTEFEALVKVRNNMYAQSAHITQKIIDDIPILDIVFDDKISAITKGQAAVLYDKNDGHLIGGGWIQ